MSIWGCPSKHKILALAEGKDWVKKGLRRTAHLVCLLDARTLIPLDYLELFLEGAEAKDAYDS